MKAVRRYENGGRELAATARAVSTACRGGWRRTGPVAVAVSVCDRTARVLAFASLAVGALGWTGAGQAVREIVLPKDSVGTAQLRDSAVTGEKIRSGSVTSADVKDGTLRAADLEDGVIPAPLRFVVHRATKDVTKVGLVELTIACEPDQTPVGGGGGFLSATGTAFAANDFYGSLINSAPLNGSTGADDRGAATGWIVTARSSGGKKRLAGWVVCAYTPVKQPAPIKTPQPPSSP